MATTPKTLSVGDWLKSLDKSLCRYANDFVKLDYDNTNILKFFSGAEFDDFNVKPSLAHRKIMLNAIAKLQTPNSRLGLEGENKLKCNILNPKKLNFNSPQRKISMADSDQDSEHETNDLTFKTPVELMLADLEEKAKLTEVEVESGKEYVDDLKKRYANPALQISVDRTTSQCGKCHLRERHNRNRCPNGECLGPESCNDLDKHPTEKKFLSEAVSNLRSKEKDLELIKQDITNKKKAIKETQSSFKFKIQSALINSNVHKYTFQTSNGRAMKQTAINNDAFILEKHYRGHVPKNLDTEAKKFQTVIDKFNRDNGILCDTKKTTNPSRKILEAKGVNFPRHNGLPVPSTDSDEESQVNRAIRESMKSTHTSMYGGAMVQIDSGTSSYSYQQEQENIPPKKRFRWD